MYLAYEVFTKPVDIVHECSQIPYLHIITTQSLSLVSIDQLMCQPLLKH